MKKASKYTGGECTVELFSFKLLICKLVCNNVKRVKDCPFFKLQCLRNLLFCILKFNHFLKYTYEIVNICLNFLVFMKTG